jgi:hypothetical protein
MNALPGLTLCVVLAVAFASPAPVQWGDTKPAHFIVSLDVAPSHRWDHVMASMNETIHT